LVAFGNVAGEVMLSEPPDPLPLTATVAALLAGVVPLAPLQVSV
jgi:hypothetical protein